MIFPREVEDGNSVIYRVVLLGKSIDDVFACNSHNSCCTDQLNIPPSNTKHLFSRLRMSFLTLISVNLLQDAKNIFQFSKHILEQLTPCLKWHQKKLQLSIAGFLRTIDAKLARLCL